MMLIKQSIKNSHVAEWDGVSPSVVDANNCEGIICMGQMQRQDGTMLRFPEYPC